MRQKQQIALNAGKLVVTHAEAWAQILKTTTSTTAATVQVMSQELAGVQTQLGDQLEMFPIGVGIRRAHGCGHVD